MRAAIYSRKANGLGALADRFYSVGFQMLEAERWRDAADVFRAMVLTWPRDERSWIALGRCHEEMGQAEVAVELYSLGTLCAPASVRCRLALGRALAARGADEQAAAVLDAAEAAADQTGDPDLISLVERERRTPWTAT
jgi:tetratricopeptide (TPR) repeat protein